MSGFSVIRAFKGCRALLAPAKSALPTPPPPATDTKSLPKPHLLANVITRLVPISPELSLFLGKPEASRTEAVKKIWLYVKKHNLQNPKNEKEIYCDDKLKTLFGGEEKVGFKDIARLLTRHFMDSAD